MTCGDKFNKNCPTGGTRVEPAEADGRPLCDHPGCGKKLRGDGTCVDGHVQGQTGTAAAPAPHMTVAGKAGLTTRSWSLVRVYKGSRPEDALGQMQALPPEGVRCQVCGKQCYSMAVEVYEPELGHIVAGEECAQHLLGNISVQEFVQQARATAAEERARRRDVARTAAEEAEAARIEAQRQEWQERHADLWQFLQQATAVDPDNDFFDSLAHRLQQLGGLTDGQMAALQKAAQGGIAEVQRRGDLRESDPAYWRAAEYALFRMKIGFRDPARDILRNIFDRAGSDLYRRPPSLSGKQRQLIQRTVKRYAKNQLYAWIRRDEDPFAWLKHERGRPDFWREVPFVLAVLAAEDVEREPDREATLVAHRMGQLLYDVMSSQRQTDDPAVPDAVTLVAADGTVVQAEGHAIENAVAHQVYCDAGQWYAEFSLPTAENQSPFALERLRVQVPLTADMLLNISDAHGRPYWWMRQAERDAKIAAERERRSSR